MKHLTHWRLEDGHYACFDIYHEGHFLSTYEVDLYANQGPDYSWAQHIARKNWSFDELIFELIQLERIFAEYSYQNPCTIPPTIAPQPDEVLNQPGTLEATPCN